MSCATLVTIGNTGTTLIDLTIPFSCTPFTYTMGWRYMR